MKNTITPCRDCWKLSSIPSTPTGRWHPLKDVCSQYPSAANSRSKPGNVVLVGRGQHLRMDSRGCEFLVTDGILNWCCAVESTQSFSNTMAVSSSGM
jgi:hypothetical protein